LSGRKTYLKRKTHVQFVRWFTLAVYHWVNRFDKYETTKTRRGSTSTGYSYRHCPTAAVQALFPSRSINRNYFVDDTLMMCRLYSRLCHCLLAALCGEPAALTVISRVLQGSFLRCPLCTQVMGIITGNQPPGKMEWLHCRPGEQPLQGYEHVGTLIVHYVSAQSSTSPIPATFSPFLDLEGQAWRDTCAYGDCLWGQTVVRHHERVSIVESGEGAWVA